MVLNLKTKIKNMKLEIVEEGIKDIPVKKLQIDQIAVITKWGNNDKHPYNGKILTVVNHDNHEEILLSVGESNCYWSGFRTLTEDYRVRVLSPGTVLKIV